MSDRQLLWQDGGRQTAVDERIMRFLAGEDVILDRKLFPYDIRATKAHVRGLQRIGVLIEDEASRLNAGLDRLLEQFQAGTFMLDERFEDGHSAIESFLTEALGDLGEKVHAGRSRNDQVLVASRLYLKDRLAEVARSCGSIARACLARAEESPQAPMPGYTHLQRAVPSSLGLWMAAFAEAFTDDLVFAAAVADLIDCNPLGTAAGYGTNLGLDRAGVGEELGFARLQINPMYAQNSRGKFEVIALSAAATALKDVQRLAWDLSLFCSAEFDFVSLPGEFTTGSSIMPNKANPDVVELLRARSAAVEAAAFEIQGLTALPSGYHRDLQFTKAPMIRGMELAVQALDIVPALVGGIGFKFDNMKAAITPEMYATDLAMEQVARGVPFRQAYRQAKKALPEAAGRDPAASLAARCSPGACGDLMLDEIRARLERAIERLPA